MTKTDEVTPNVDTPTPVSMNHDILTPAERLKLAEEALELASDPYEDGAHVVEKCERALEALRGMEVTEGHVRDRERESWEDYVFRDARHTSDPTVPAALLTLKGEDDG